jgi:hypothetical protein
MRKPRDFDNALKTLTDKAKALQQIKRRQLGELVIATGADALDMEVLAGALLGMVESTDKAQKESWRKRGAAFFRGKTRSSAGKTLGGPERATPDDSNLASA